MIARESELTTLLSLLDTASKGRGGLCMVVGEAGIGKTRLAHELSRRATERGALVLWGQGAEGDEAPAYWSWVQAIRSFLRRHDRSTLETLLGSAAPYLAQIVPELRDMLGTLPAPAPADADFARFRLFDGVSMFLRRAAEVQPLVLVFEDLHEADRATLHLLQFLTGQVGDVRVFVVGTYRENEARSRPIARGLLGEIAGASKRIPLRGLETADVERFIRVSTGYVPAPVLVRAVCDATDGNPFFVDAFVRLLMAEGRIQRTDPSPLDGFPIPGEVREAIRRRTASLDAGTRHLLSLAAVLGREFDLTILAQASGMEMGRLLQTAR